MNLLSAIACWARRLALPAAAVALLGAATRPPAAPAPTYAVSAQIPGPDGFWDYASFDPVKRRLYVSRGDGVLALNVDTGKLTPRLAPGDRTHTPLPLPGGRRLLLTNGGDNNARLVSTASGALIADIPTAPGPDGAVYDPRTGLALVLTRSGVVTLVDPNQARAVGRIDVGVQLEFGAVDGRGHAFVNEVTRDAIAVLDLPERRVMAHYPLAGCESPSGLAYDPTLGVLISACANNLAKVVRASDGSTVADLVIAKGPDAVILDEGRRLAFIPCGWEGVLDVVSLKSLKDIQVVEHVRTEPGARTGAVDPKSGKVYLPTATYTLAGGHPMVTPGTFKILVVSPH
jgi:hypothetical protein